MNTRNSSIKGKAYEYACVLALQEIITPIRSIELEQNESLRIAKSRYENDIASEEKSEMLLSAKAGIETIIDMEPKIIEDGKDNCMHTTGQCCRTDWRYTGYFGDSSQY